MKSCNSSVDKRTDGQMKQKLYAPQHTSYAGVYLVDEHKVIAKLLFPYMLINSFSCSDLILKKLDESNTVSSPQ